MEYTKPDVKEELNRIVYSWPSMELKIHADRVDDDGIGELWFYHDNSTGSHLLEVSKVNLLSTVSKLQIVKKMAKHSSDTPWEQIITAITATTLSISRRGEPLLNLGKKPAKMKLDFQLVPLLEKNQPTTIYSPGGYAKSYLACYLACLIQFNYPGINDWFPECGNVLYLDWESSQDNHERRVWAIKQGLGIDAEETFLYRFCDRPLVDDAHVIQRICQDNDIALVIVDSQMAAAGYGPDAAQVSSRFYNALRSLRCTSLTLDHMAKSEWGKPNTASESSTGPYGSVVKYNRSRSQFEIKRSQAAGSDTLELALIQRKNNEGRLLKPIGIRISFENGEENELLVVRFESYKLESNPELSKVVPLRDQLISLLRTGPEELSYLAEVTERSEATIRTTLHRHKTDFVRTGDKWGLASFL